MGFNRTAVSSSLTGVSPLRGSHAALPIACDALNARTVAAREYHCIFCAVVAHKPLHLFFGAVLIARLSKKRLGAPTVWLGAKGTYPICPMLRRRYLAGFLCQGSFVISGQKRGKG